MKKHLIPILIIILLAVTGLLLYLAAYIYTFFIGSVSNGLETFVFIALVPSVYGPAAALLIPLHRKGRTVPRGYAWLGVAAFIAAVIGLAVMNVGFFAIYMPDTEAWWLLSWAVWGLLLPFFVSSVVHLKEPVTKRTHGKAIATLLVGFTAVLLAGGGLFLHRMSQDRFMEDAQEREMYMQFQERIANDDTWGTVDRVTDSVATETGGQGEERTLNDEEQAAMTSQCRELLLPLSKTWNLSFFARIAPSQRAKYLVAHPELDITMDGDACYVSQCTWTDYTWTGAEEIEIVFTQGEIQHTVTLYWAPDPEE